MIGLVVIILYLSLQTEVTQKGLSLLKFFLNVN